MKLYKVEYGLTTRKGDELVVRRWIGTQAGAKAFEKSLLDGDAYDIEVELVDVPVDKEGLIEWLNTHLGGDEAP